MFNAKKKNQKRYETNFKQKYKNSLMKMYFVKSVALISLIIQLSVVQSDIDVELAKCKSDVENCEQFSFHQVKANVSNLNQKNLNTAVLKDLNLVEDQIIFEQSHIQENGNFGTLNQLSTRSKRDHRLI